MTRDEYWFWLCNIPGIYQETLQKLLSVCGAPEAIYQENADNLKACGLLTAKQAAAFAESKNTADALYLLETIRRDGIRFLHPESEEFPEKLKTIPDPPFCLYVKGNLPDPNLPSAGMVGARACSEYGKKMALSFAGSLAAAGVQIISGMAAGIDSMSARGALSVGGKTFAVLGSGIDVIYPVENFSLYYEIISSGGGIISEYPMGTQPIAWQFPLRNRLISGLSDRLLVMEAKERSGTLITVRYALEQGRDVYALPGRLTDKASFGCNRMIADGAGILISPEYLLEEIYRNPKLEESPKLIEQNDPGANRKSEEGTLSMNQTASQQNQSAPNLYRRKKSPSGASKVKKGKQKTEISGMREDLKKIFDLIETKPTSLQSIIEKSKESAEITASLLAEMELLGLVQEVSKNTYIRIL